MHFTTSLSRSFLLVGLLLVATVLGQNTTIPSIAPAQAEPTLEPSGQTTSPTVLNATQEAQSPSAEPQAIATLPPTALPEKLQCYDNTTVLRGHLRSRNTFTPDTYELCSNTVFEIGSVSDFGQECCVDGQAPLHPRSNTKIRCGPDGNPNNNCTMQGGLYQFMNLYTVFEEQAENAVLEGITFKDSVDAAVFFGDWGTITFRDCVFEGHSGQSGVIYSFHSGPSANGEEERKLQTGVVWKSQEFLFEGCVFQHNQQAEVLDFTKFGVVTVDLGYDVGTFENCTFFNNSYGDPENVRGYAINFAAGSKLTMINNCFIDNDFIGEGVVMLGGADDLSDSSGNYGTQDDLLTCQYVHAGTGDAYECIEYEATACSISLSGSDGGPSSSAVPRVPELTLIMAVLVSFVVPFP